MNVICNSDMILLQKHCGCECG